MFPPPDILTVWYIWSSENDPNVYKQAANAWSGWLLEAGVDT